MVRDGFPKFKCIDETSLFVQLIFMRREIMSPNERKKVFYCFPNQAMNYELKR